MNRSIAARVRVGSTGNRPERTDRVRIAAAGEPGKPRTVVMSLGAATDSDLPMPDLRPGDLIRAFAELELTTDYEDPNHPGLIGHAYSYAPEVEAKLLLAADKDASEAQPDRALPLGDLWRGCCTHRRHHEVIVFSAAEYEVPARGLPWPGPGWINLTVSAAHPNAHRDDVILVGENEKEPVVDQDVSGIRVVRFRPRGGGHAEAEKETHLRREAIPIAKRPTVVISKRLHGLRAGEQLLVRGRLVTDPRRLGYDVRVSTRMFLADDPADLEPAGHAQEAASWKGHLTKENGFNCLADGGPKATEKFGVMRMLRDAKGPLFVNLVATSSAPFRDPPETGDDLAIEGGAIEVTRYPPELAE